MNPILKKRYYIKMSDGAVYAIPMIEIAMDRAEKLMSQFDDDLAIALEDTLVLFEKDESKIEQWAKEQIDWSEIQGHAVLITPADSTKTYHFDWKDKEVKIR